MKILLTVLWIASLIFPAAAAADMVTEWNEIALATATAGRHGASDASRTTAMVHAAVFCIAPQYVADDLLRAEGFTDVQYCRAAAGLETAKALAAGRADITLNFVAPFVMQIDVGDPILMLGGIHVGCLVLFGTDWRFINELKQELKT